MCFYLGRSISVPIRQHMSVCMNNNLWESPSMATSSDFRFITQFDVSSHCSRNRVTVEEKNKNLIIFFCITYQLDDVGMMTSLHRTSEIFCSIFNQHSQFLFPKKILKIKNAFGIENEWKLLLCCIRSKAGFKVVELALTDIGKNKFSNQT